MDRDELLEPFERMIAKLFPSARVREIERGADWSGELAEVEESGFLDLFAPEDAGGAALPFEYAIPLFSALGRHAAPLEIGQAMIERSGRDAYAQASARAVLLAAAIAGASNHLLEVTTAYANERNQFGKPIGRQQALQQNLALMAEHCVAVRMASELAAQGSEWPGALQAAVAKTVASQSAPLIANIAHAVHGAIGISEEHDLQLYTRRLHAWRLEAGSEGLWSRRIGHGLLLSCDTSVDWLRDKIFGEGASRTPLSNGTASRTKQ